MFVKTFTDLTVNVGDHKVEIYWGSIITNNVYSKQHYITA